MKPFRATLFDSGDGCLRNVEGEIPNCTVIPDSPWIKCEERMPEESESDYFNAVLAYYNDAKLVCRIDLISWNSATLGKFFTHWKPTGLIIPEPPREM